MKQFSLRGVDDQIFERSFEKRKKDPADGDARVAEDFAERFELIKHELPRFIIAESRGFFSCGKTKRPLLG